MNEIENLLNCRIIEKKRVYGGDINRSSKIMTSDGKSYFLKENNLDRFEMLVQEAKGLEALRACKTVEIPSLFGIGTDKEQNTGFLILEWIEPGKNKSWETLGERLAMLHKTKVADKFGYDCSNWIGLSVQCNTWSNSWIEFFGEYRLMPQIRMAKNHLGSKLYKEAVEICKHLDLFLEEPESPSLLHGDLWSGNVIFGKQGRPYLIDPAVYVGHREADLAMTELFGGFPRVFYDAYNAIYPLDSGYKKRRDLYNLYHLLNHLNLFGCGYLPEVARGIEFYGNALL